MIRAVQGEQAGQFFPSLSAFPNDEGEFLREEELRGDHANVATWRRPVKIVAGRWQAEQDAHVAFAIGKTFQAFRWRDVHGENRVLVMLFPKIPVVRRLLG